MLYIFILFFLPAREPQVKYQYKFVRDQFEVVPRKDLLIKEGFVVAPEGHVLNPNTAAAAGAGGVQMSDLSRMESNQRENKEEDEEDENEIGPPPLKVSVKPVPSTATKSKPKRAKKGAES